MTKPHKTEFRTLHIKVPVGLDRQLDHLVDDLKLYPNKSEAVRLSIRDLIFSDLRLHKAIREWKKRDNSS